MKDRKPESIRAGVVQFSVRLGDVDGNLKRALQGIRELGDKGAGLIVLPEMWSSGFDNANLAALARESPRVLAALSEAARKYGAFIVGSIPEKGGRGIHNTAWAVSPEGEMTAKYRKVHLFRPTREPRFFLGGDRMVSVKTPAGPAGLLTCYDLRFPEMARALVLKGALILIVMAQWPQVRAAHWEALLAARAIENQVFVVACNRSGKDPGLAYAGRSRILGPTGEVLAKAGTREANISAWLDMDKIAEARKAIPCFEDRKPKVYP